MNSGRFKRSVVLSSALILALAPVGVQQASAGTPSETHISAATVIPQQNEERRGFRDGYRDGFRDARNDCRRDDYRTFDNFVHGTAAYERGYDRGYGRGYVQAERRYC